MTLDEAIKHAEEVMVENLEKTKGRNASDSIALNCFECAEEHRQLAEWLKELKVYKEQQPCEDCISREKAKQFLYERLDRLNDDELYDIFSTIIDDMYNELPSVTPATKWHKVEDELPNPNVAVLTYINTGVVETYCLAYWNDVRDGWEDWLGYELLKDKGYNVVAWTELPEWEE